MVSFVAGGADPGRGAERLTERFFGRGPAAKKRFRVRLSKDVACRPSVKSGANVPSYSSGGAALLVDSRTCLEGCGLSAKCEIRGQRPQLQWRRRRLVGGFAYVS